MISRKSTNRKSKIRGWITLKEFCLRDIGIDLNVVINFFQCSQILFLVEDRAF